MSNKFTGKVEIQDTAENTTIELDGNTANITGGGRGKDGEIRLKDSAGNTRLFFMGRDGAICINDSAGRHALYADELARLWVGAGEGNEGSLQVCDSAGRPAIKLNATHASFVVGTNGNAGEIYALDDSAKKVFIVNSINALLVVGTRGNDGHIMVVDDAGRTVMSFLGNSAFLRVGATGNAGDVILVDAAGKNAIKLQSQHATLTVGATGNDGNIIVKDDTGNQRIWLNGNTGDIRLQGADCAEEFDITETERIDPGTVLVVEDESKLQSCNKPYDKRVAGVVSGGNGSNPGIILDKNSTQNRRLPIALNGKVYCKVDAQYSPIEVGDLLTTSSTSGHAMKAVDPSKAFGAVIGKALHPLREGKGLIPILAALQ